MKRSLISIGDVLRAAHELKPGDGDTSEAIGGLLGMEANRVTTPVVPSVGAALPSTSLKVASTETESVDRLRWRRKLQQAAPSPAAPQTPIAFTVNQVEAGTDKIELPTWLTTGQSLAPDLTTEAPSPLPLFSRVQRRGILSAALATHVNEGEIDLDAAIESLAELRPLTNIPRVTMPTLRRGVQVLLDCGAGMDPFLPDQEALVHYLDDILSDERLEVLYFVGCPARGVSMRPRGQQRAWRPPPTGTPVLIVTDLGIGGPLFDDDRASAREWLQLSESARARGHVPIALVPYEAHRWPPRLARAMVLLHWSERTTAGEIRRATRDALGRRK